MGTGGTVFEARLEPLEAKIPEEFVTMGEKSDCDALKTESHILGLELLVIS